MITISNVSKKFFDQRILNGLTLQFPDKGLYFILGPSGCGKSTLLNCIAGLLDYDGEIFINGDNLLNMDEKEASDYRLRNIGFVFQDFKLFQHDTVYENIVMPMECITSLNTHYQEQRIEDILQIVGVSKLRDEPIANLSGGEKQRIAIARSLINDPKVLLCDEPTGALDSVNKISIMSILKTISTTRLVVVVSHDEELSKKYADGIYTLKNGKVFSKDINGIENKQKYLPIYDQESPLKKSKVPLSFLFRHTKNAIKERKFRSVITNLMVSFGLLGSGMAFMVSDTIYQSVVGMYSNVISDDQIIMTLNASNSVSNQIVSASKDELNKIKNNYKEYIDDIGACYVANFEEYYKDSNSLNLVNAKNKFPISGYSARNINDFKLLKDCNKKIYPNDIQELKDDEVILSIDPGIIRQICYQLRIQKTVESLSDYILKNKVLLCYDFANFSWQYHDEQILRFKGFVLDNTPLIYHSNPLWNEYMYETMMRMPSNENISSQEYYPWILKKINFFYLKDNPEKFLNKTITDDNLKDYVFELANDKYFKLVNKNKLPMNNHRLLVFKNKFMSISPSDWKYIKSLQKSVKNPIFSTNSGYSVYGTSLLSGFTKVMFFANSEENLESTIDIFSSHGYDPLASINLPEGVLQGHYTKTSNNGVFFKGLDGEKINGSPPKNLNEIVISTGMAKALFKDENAIGNHLNLALTLNNSSGAENKHNLSFKSDKLLITGIVKNDKNILYQTDYWTLLYFQCKLGVSIFELLPFGMSMEIDEKTNTKKVIKSLEAEFPYYSFLNPMEDIENQADTLCFYMKIILFILSITTLLIAICLISICNYLHVIEIRKDIGLIRCLGINKKESQKLLYFHSLFVAITGAITSIIELFIFYLVMRFGLQEFFNIQFNFSFNLLPYVFIVILSIIVGLIPAYFVSFKLNNLDPLSALK